MSLYIEAPSHIYEIELKKNANIFRMDREIGAIKDTANEHSERSWEIRKKIRTNGIWNVWKIESECLAT